MQGDVDALYQLPLGEFTAARNALAASLKKAGRAAEASEVKALPKPSVSAWVVNQLFWRRRPQFDRLLDAGERLRKAQAAQLTRGAADVREPLNARREAAALLVSAAEGMLRDGGYGAARDTLRRVSTTLEALSVYGLLPDGPRAGRLADDVPMPGFDTMAALLPGGGALRAARRPSPDRPPPKPAGKPELRAVPDTASARRREQQRKEQLAEAKAEVRQAERALGVARKQAERAAAAREAAAQRAAQSDTRRAELERQLAAAAKEAAEAHEAARRAAAAAAEAERAADGAARAHDAARRALEQLESDRR